MKTAIVYYSKHHGNTKKLIDAIAAKHEVTLINATQTQSFDLREYDLIGFASGIYYSKFHKTVLEFAQKNLPGKKSVFFLYTYGRKMEGYTKAIREAVLEKSAQIKGAFGCRDSIPSVPSNWWVVSQRDILIQTIPPGLSASLKI
jgi:menaquinone-dependent protoporphyrinogen IX oxidase